MGRDIEGLAFKGADLLIGDADANEVPFWDPSTEAVSETWSGLPETAHGLGHSGDGVWMVDGGDDMVYRPVGEGVPEPSTVALFTAGLALTGLVGLRRTHR